MEVTYFGLMAQAYKETAIPETIFGICTGISVNGICRGIV